jgi:hypothetical protein
VFTNDQLNIVGGGEGGIVKDSRLLTAVLASIGRAKPPTLYKVSSSTARRRVFGSEEENSLLDYGELPEHVTSDSEDDSCVIRSSILGRLGKR